MTLPTPAEIDELERLHQFATEVSDRLRKGLPTQFSMRVDAMNAGDNCWRAFPSLLAAARRCAELEAAVENLLPYVRLYSRDSEQYVAKAQTNVIKTAIRHQLNGCAEAISKADAILKAKEAKP